MALSDTAIKALKPESKPYKVTDDKGLYLFITPAGGKLWRLDYRFEGKRKTLAVKQRRKLTTQQRPILTRGSG